MFKNLFSMKAGVEEMAAAVATNFAVEASYGEATVVVRNKATGDAAFTLIEEAAVEFIEASENLADSTGLDLNTAMLAEAKAYVNCL